LHDVHCEPDEFGSVAPFPGVLQEGRSATM
jgi:hypothetical protein